MSTGLFRFMARYRGILVSAFMLSVLVMPHVAIAGDTSMQEARLAQADTSAAADEKPKGVSNIDCGLMNLGDCGNALIAWFGGIFIQIASLIAYVAGTLFNFAVITLVLEYSKYLGNSAGLLAGWGVLRDIGNIALLFGFVWIGVRTILNIGHYSVGKTLPLLIIFAALLNFRRGRY
jgi:hypothetical protein